MTLRELLTVVTFVTAVGCGVVGGVFFAFSTFVMQALARIPAPQGIAAMQAINITAVTFVFMTALFGTALGCLALAGAAIFAVDRSLESVELLSGAALYLCGVIGVTIAANVPRNDALARLSPDAPGAEHAWKDYVTTWTAWNHVRTLCAIAAAVALMLAL
jgi:uncharacterized membrane protein